MSQKYNGWTNWETWLYAVHYDNFWTEWAQDNNVTEPEGLAEFIKDSLEVELSECGKLSPFFDDILANTLREVNFYEIAEKTIEEVRG